MKHEDGKCLHKRITHLGYVIRSRVKSTESLKNSLSVGSKRILKDYEHDLSVSSGLKKPGFDKSMKKLLRKYVYSKIQFKKQLKYLNNLKDENGFRFSRDLKLYSMCEDAMIRFSDKDHTSFRWNNNYQQALEQFSNELRGLHLKPLLYNSDDDVKHIFQKADSHSGFNYVLTGVKKKGDNIEGVQSRVCTMEKSAVDNGSFDLPIMIDFRKQASGEYDDDGNQTNTCKHKLRVISMIDMHFVASESRYIVPLQNVMCRFDWYAGGKNDYQISSILSNFRTKYNYYLSIDYSSFDQTLPGWLIEDVCKSFESAFDMNDYELKLWEVITHDYIHKDFILNEGILHSDKGLCSGVRNTQPCGSSANRIAIMTYMIAKGIKNYDMMIMGDDNIIFTKEPIDLLDLSTYLKKNFGLIIKVEEKTTYGDRTMAPKFLSRFWTSGGPYRNQWQLMSRLLFPERYREYDQDDVTPQMVLFSYILMYPRGMERLMDVRRFKQDNPNLSSALVWSRVDGRYLTGIMAYVRDYQMGFNRRY